MHLYNLFATRPGRAIDAKAFHYFCERFAEAVIDSLKTIAGHQLASLVFGSIIALTATAVHANNDDDQSPSITRQPANAATNSFGVNNLQLAGIKTQPLASAQHRPEYTAYGTVVSLEPLLMLRQQYLSARAMQDSAQAKYQEADLNLSRTRNLHDQDIVSTRRLQEQQAQWHSDKANLAASSSQQEAVLASADMQWGDTLTDWFIRTKGKAAEPFLKHREQLLQITLPANTHLNSGITSIFVDEHGQRDQAVTATLISAAPQVDPINQGERYFFKYEGHNLAFGAHMTAWIPEDGQKTAGVIIPESAVVWHLGQAYVFVKSTEGEFSRRALPEMTADIGGYFSTGSLQPGEEVVITGAQTLLSHELKNLIPSEDND
jgi:hypothetical protein